MSQAPIRISGRSTGAPDPRTTAHRADLADIALAGTLVAPRYAAPVARSVVVPRAALLEAPDRGATAASELLLGEQVRLFEAGSGFGWVQGRHDGYVGYVALDALGPVTDAAGTRALVGPGDALLFAGPRVKAPVHAAIPAGAELQVEDHDARFVRLVAGPHEGAYLHRRHLMPRPFGGDWVALAEAFIGSPYRWGGRTRAGVDCSGLIQMAWKLAGRLARRDSDMLFADAGQDLPDGASLARGDIAWWPGHIGVMVDGTRLLHANAFHMTTLVEPLEAVAARAAADGGPPPRLRRPA
jgi:cell wall-associated NlpC family hydrolase